MRRALENNIELINPLHSIVGFFDYIRENGINVGLKETEQATKAADLGLISNQSSFKYGLRSICCGCSDDIIKFDQLFEDYWIYLGEIKKRRITIKSDILKEENDHGTLIMMGSQSDEEQDSNHDGKNITGADQTERLRRTDFTKINEIESAIFEDLAQNLWKQMGYRLKCSP